jgi:hypothetical protein
MKILGEDSKWLPFREKLTITADLRLVGATEQAGYVVRYPIGSEKVGWLRAAIYIATTSGLFAFQRTSGWDEPGRTADGTVLEPWSTHGTFTPWQRLRSHSDQSSGLLRRLKCGDRAAYDCTRVR